MYMKDIKTFAKKEKELKIWIQTIKIYNQDIGREFGIDICAVLIMKSRQKETTEGRELPNQKTFEEKTKVQVHGNSRSQHHHKEIKRKISIEYLKRTRKLLETKVCGKNLIRNKHLGRTFCNILGTILKIV